MKSIWYVFCFSVLFTATCLFAPLVKGQDNSESKAKNGKQWTSLFDGKTLTGWSGDENLWSVDNGTITGRTTESTNLKQNSFLIWDGKTDDFELRLKFRIENGNSGVQFRSQDLGEFHVGGYQADIDSQKRYTGILYEERGRGILSERGKKISIDAEGNKSEGDETCNQEEFSKSVDESKWCDYVIRAEGNHITQSINGLVTVDIVDNQEDKAAKSGILALQIHVGPPMIVQFKDIEIRSLKK